MSSGQPRGALVVIVLSLFLLLNLVYADSPNGPEKKNKLQQQCSIESICAAVQNSTPSRVERLAVYPVVDLFYMYSENSRLSYMHNGHYWTMPSVAQKFSDLHPGTNHSDIRIHVSVDSDKMLAEARSFGYYAYDLREYIRKHEKFRAVIHKSVQSTEYEVTIFRWKVYNSIVTEWNKAHNDYDKIRRILTVDGDVLMTMSPARFYQNVVDAFKLNSTLTISADESQEDTHELINIAYGVVELFSPRGLAAFDAFIDDWYTGTEQEVVNRCWTAGYKFWSDMMLLEMFLRTNTTVRNNCFEFDRYKQYYEGWRKDSDNQCLLKALQCLPMSNYHDQGIRWGMHFYADGARVTMTNSSHVNTFTKDNLSIQGPKENYPYCFMHFQGAQKKSLMYTFGRMFEILLTPVHSTANNASDTGAEFSGGIVVQPESSTRLYYIFPNATRYKFASRDELHVLVSSGAHVHKEVPFEVISAFPPVHSGHNEQ